MEELQAYSWPGNIREPRNAVETALSEGGRLTFQLPEAGLSTVSPCAACHENYLVKREFLAASG